ncbi:MAG: CPBP family intramembrane metalloprotease, partial [Anaerolineales bacterium]|nr:CPBP family intramembrane metalloprotease [Anaerolineales bacterium]
VNFLAHDKPEFDEFRAVDPARRGAEGVLDGGDHLQAGGKFIENLLQGPPPADPFPQVVGITVHLTFARRAFALARWYRERGAVVVLGGLHVLSCPDACAPHADALAIAPYMPYSIGRGKTADLGPQMKDWTVDQMLDHFEKTAFTDSLERMRRAKAVADKYGVKLIAYEGGQHMVAFMKDQALLMNSALFGMAHYLYGSPGGVLGFAMTAFLGWLLGKAMLETKGFAWSWFLHFLPDVVVFMSYAVLWARG